MCPSVGGALRPGSLPLGAEAGNPGGVAAAPPGHRAGLAEPRPAARLACLTSQSEEHGASQRVTRQPPCTTTGVAPSLHRPRWGGRGSQSSAPQTLAGSGPQAPAFLEMSPSVARVARPRGREQKRRGSSARPGVSVGDVAGAGLTVPHSSECPRGAGPRGVDAQASPDEHSPLESPLSSRPGPLGLALGLALTPASHCPARPPASGRVSTPGKLC